MGKRAAKFVQPEAAAGPSKIAWCYLVLGIGYWGIGHDPVYPSSFASRDKHNMYEAGCQCTESVDENMNDRQVEYLAPVLVPAAVVHIPHMRHPHLLKPVHRQGPKQVQLLPQRHPSPAACIDAKPNAP